MYSRMLTEARTRFPRAEWINVGTTAVQPYAINVVDVAEADDVLKSPNGI